MNFHSNRGNSAQDFFLTSNGFPRSVSDWDAINHGEGGILHVLARVFSCSQFWALFNWRHIPQSNTAHVGWNVTGSLKCHAPLIWKYKLEPEAENWHFTKDIKIYSSNVCTLLYPHVMMKGPVHCQDLDNQTQLYVQCLKATFTFSIRLHELDKLNLRNSSHLKGKL